MMHQGADHDQAEATAQGAAAPGEAGTPACRCGKPPAVCVCDRLGRYSTRLRVVVLQHPREQDVLLGSVPLLLAALPQAQCRIGLSWASLHQALGSPAVPAMPRRWAVLYPHKGQGEALRAGAATAAVATPRHAAVTATGVRPSAVSRDRGNSALPAANPTAADGPLATGGALAGGGATLSLTAANGAPLLPSDIDGIVALDGSWSQAKALWWRNPWLLKLARLSVQPHEPSIYGRLRREPQRHCLSTLEAVTDTLAALGEDPNLRRALRRAFRTMVQRARPG